MTAAPSLYLFFIRRFCGCLTRLATKKAPDISGHYKYLIQEMACSLKEKLGRERDVVKAELQF